MVAAGAADHSLAIAPSPDQLIAETDGLQRIASFWLDQDAARLNAAGDQRFLMPQELESRCDVLRDDVALLLDRVAHRRAGHLLIGPAIKRGEGELGHLDVGQGQILLQPRQQGREDESRGRRARESVDVHHGVDPRDERGHCGRALVVGDSIVIGHLELALGVHQLGRGDNGRLGGSHRRRSSGRGEYGRRSRRSGRRRERRIEFVQ